jgi:predicted NAD/FAD-dependent oxidoreductase
LETADVLVLGAGVAGLRCAQLLTEGGARVILLDKGRRVGGRLATRVVDGQPVDHGQVFLHGADPTLRDALDSVSGVTVFWGWPRVVEGKGTPCSPAAFQEGQWRVALAEGINAFPAWLGKDLHARTGVKVKSLKVGKGTVTATDEAGNQYTARDVILTPPAEQSAALMATLPDVEEVRSARSLLTQTGTIPCLTLMAGYDLHVPAPAWDIWFPDDGEVFKLVSHDSRKRRDPKAAVMVYQARSTFSRVHLEEDEAAWAALMLVEAGKRLGAWAATPRWTQAHRWRYARTEGGGRLAAPMCLTLEKDVRVGLAGEMFGMQGGVEAAWLSAARLCARLQGKAP